MLDADFVFLVVLLVILAVVIYFELRFMRTRNKDYMNRQIDKDDAYNTIATTKAISTALRQKGKDTREAEQVIIQAELAYKRGSFVSSRELAKKAREILINAPMIELATPTTETATSETVSDEERKTVHEVKKLEPNMIESRFIINSCKDRLQLGEGSGQDLTESKLCLARAEEHFAEKRYGDALREGLKARRMMGEPTIAPREVKIDAPVIKVPKPERRCAQCDAVISSDDLFCRKCGARAEIPRVCTHCQAELGSGDAFCPKCGRRV